MASRRTQKTPAKLDPVAQAKQGANEVLADTASALGQQATARRDAVESQYLATKNNIANQRLSIYNQQAANATQAANQGLSAGMGLVGADISSALDSGRGLFERLFNR